MLKSNHIYIFSPKDIFHKNSYFIFKECCSYGETIGYINLLDIILIFDIKDGINDITKWIQVLKGDIIGWASINIDYIRKWKQFVEI